MLLELNVNNGLNFTDDLVVENYAEDGKKIYSFYKSPSKILCSAFNFSHSRNTGSMIIGCEDNFLYLLDAKSLIVTKKIKITIEPEDLAYPGYEIKYNNNTYFENFSLDYLIAPLEDSVFVGLSTGLVKEYSLSTLQKKKVFNPIPYEHKSDGEKSLTLLVENLMISGIESMVYGNISEIIFTNHKKMFTNCFNRTFTLEKTPIYSYKASGELHKRFTVEGDILSSRILENRNFYLCLTSIKSQVYVFDFFENSLILKFSCDIMKDPQKSMHFTCLSALEFEMNQRFQTADKVFHSDQVNKEVIDGDILFFIEDNGSIMISKLKYENDKGQTTWVPLKFLNAKNEEKDLKKSIQQNIAGKQMSSLTYNAYKDKLYFGDNQGNVFWLDKVTQIIYPVQSLK